MSDFRRRKILLIGGLSSLFIIGSLLVLVNLPQYKDPAATSVAKFTATPAQSPTGISLNQTAPESQGDDLSIIPRDSATDMAADTRSQTPSPSPTSINAPAQKNASTTPAPTRISGSITGRLLLDGAVAEGVTIKLEDQDLNTISETVVGGDGTYTFANLEGTARGYNLVFSREWNTQYELGQVISWGWVGPIPVASGAVVQIPDFDVSLLGFEPTTPAPNASLSVSLVTSSTPMRFEWAAYPEATSYWVDLVYGQEQTMVWQSPVAESTTISFDGTVNSGAHIQPGEYRWGVGAQRDLGPFKLTVYGYLPSFTIVP